MGRTSASETEVCCSIRLSWIRSAATVLLLTQLCSCCAARGTSCQILRCNADFVAATLELGGVEGPGGGPAGSAAARSAGYCGALRSYGTCTKRMARACRGDLAYHSAVQGIEDLLLQHRCPRAGPTTTAQPGPPLAPQAPPMSSSGEACLFEKGRGGGAPAAEEYLHCGVFGDPHVRTFSDDFQTCSARGAWPLVDNHFLYVQATNTPTGGGASTALTKITIIFKSWRQCVQQQVYQAELDNVPAAFADGSVTSGGSGGGGGGGGGERPGGRHQHHQHHSIPSARSQSPGWRHSHAHGHSHLSVRSHSPGRHAEIRAPHIGAVLVVRQSGRSLGLSVRAPRSVVEAFGPEQDVQLCVWGCPETQRIRAPPPAPHASSSSSYASAQAHCSSLLPSRDVYYGACVFDVLASGGRTNASLAAVAALEDARGMIGDDEDRLHLAPPGLFLDPPDPHVDAAAAAPAARGGAGVAGRPQPRPGLAVLLALSVAAANALLGDAWNDGV